MKSPSRFQINSAAFKIDGYVFIDSNVESTAGRDRAKEIAFDLAKAELKSHILEELRVIEDMDIATYYRHKKRDFRV